MNPMSIITIAAISIAAAIGAVILIGFILALAIGTEEDQFYEPYGFD